MRGRTHYSVGEALAADADREAVLRDLARVKAAFQLRAIAAVIGAPAPPTPEAPR